MTTSVNVTRHKIGGRDTTVIEADEFPGVYFDHSRDWIELGDARFSTDVAFAGGYEATPADVIAWLRAVADALEAVSS